MASLFSSRTFQSEMGAIMSESLLGTEEFIDTILSKETSIAEKVMKKIKDLKAMFERLGNAEARAEYKRLSKAEKLYLNAIEKAGYKYRNGKILVRRKKEEIDSTSQNEYNSDEIQLSRKESDLWEGLTKQEQAQLYQRVDALHHSNYTEYRLRSGNYLLDIENKVIETNGDFDSPSVEGYVEFNKFSSKISIARDYFYEQVNNGRTIRESVEYINEVCQEEVATLHGYDDSQDNRFIGEQGRSNDSNRENSGRNGRGRKGSQTNKRAIRYNFETREITYSDGTTTKFSLKETQKINLERRGVKGDSSKLARVVEEYKKKIATLNEKLKDEKAHNKAVNRLLDKIQKIKDIKYETFLNATQYKNDLFKGSIEKLSKIYSHLDANSKLDSAKAIGVALANGS